MSKEILIRRIKTILIGIDETETDSEYGWWETSTGAYFGEEKLRQLIKAAEEL